MRTKQQWTLELRWPGNVAMRCAEALPGCRTSRLLSSTGEHGDDQEALGAAEQVDRPLTPEVEQLLQVCCINVPFLHRVPQLKMHHPLRLAEGGAAASSLRAPGALLVILTGQKSQLLVRQAAAP